MRHLKRHLAPGKPDIVLDACMATALTIFAGGLAAICIVAVTALARNLLGTAG